MKPMPMHQPTIQSDPNHPCPICGGGTERVYLTMTPFHSTDERKGSTQVTRQCADPSCSGRSGVPFNGD
jgi:hypothetical protein